jgi:phosphoserine phosphatase
MPRRAAPLPDELAAARWAAVERMTDAAMRGEVPLEEVYGRRLALIRPTRASLAALAERYVEAAIPDARDAVAALQAAGVVVRVISGGLLPAVLAFTRWLGVSDARVAAVDVYFDADGGYAGYDTTSPLARSGGKRELLERWRRELPPDELPLPVMLVGDGATDLEAKPAAECFVAFAGVGERAAVVAAADAVVRERALTPVVALALGAGAHLSPIPEPSRP